MPSAAERYYAAETACCFLQYSRPDLTDRYLEICRRAGDEFQQKAAGLRTPAEVGRLPTPIDADHSVAQFDGNYARHRFASR